MQVPGVSVASLSDLAVIAVAQEVEDHGSALLRMPPALAKRVWDVMPTTTPVAVAAQLCDDQQYWQRACASRWPQVTKAAHGGSWKRAFIENYVAELIGGVVEKQGVLAEQADLLADSVHELDVQEVRVRVDFHSVMRSLKRLHTLSVCFQVRNLGLQLDWSLFGMHPDDAVQLALGLRDTRSLSTLRLQRCGIDNALVQTLAAGIGACATLTELDLAHNRIGDAGAEALATAVVEGRAPIMHLDVSDNQLRAGGARSLARCITSCETLQRLYLSLNRIELDGLRALCDAAHSVVTTLAQPAAGDAGATTPRQAGDSNGALLQRLHVQANLITGDIDDSVVALLEASPAIVAVRLGSNEVTCASGEQLAHAVSKCASLRELDLACTNIDADTQVRVHEVLDARRTDDAVRDAAFIVPHLQPAQLQQQLMQYQQQRQTPSRLARPAGGSSNLLQASTSAAHSRSHLSVSQQQQQPATPTRASPMPSHVPQWRGSLAAQMAAAGASPQRA